MFSGRLFMKRKHLSLLILFIIVFGVTGCRINNGDIGVLYGVWTVTEVEVDGEPYSGWKQNGYNESFFQFQNNICFVTRTNERFDTQSQACTWQWLKEDTRIELNFTHTDNNNPEPGGYTYAPPAWLLLTVPAVYTFEIDWTDEKHCVWSTTNSEGQHLTYHLKKTY